MAKLSDNGRIAVAAGYTSGTKEYRTYMRFLQRTNPESTAAQTRTGTKSAAKVAQLPAGPQRTAIEAKIAERAQAKQVISQARKEQGRSVADPLPLTVIVHAKIAVGNSARELARPARDVAITITNPEHLALLRAADWERFLKWDFYGDPDSDYPLTVTGASVRSQR